MTTEADHLYLDRASCRTLMSWLRDFAWLAPELDNVTTRQTRYTGRAERKGSDTPVVFNPASSELGAEVQQVFMSWVALVCEVRHLPLPHPRTRTTLHTAVWLREHVMDLAQVEPARDAYEEIRELHRKVFRMVDRPEEQEFVGPCQSDVPGVECDGVYTARGADTKNCASCGVCIDVPSVMAVARMELAARLYTERELVHALKVALRRTVPRQTVRSWISSGRLEPRAGRYELSEALELADKPKRGRRAGTGDT